MLNRLSAWLASKGRTKTMMTDEVKLPLDLPNWAIVKDLLWDLHDRLVNKNISDQETAWVMQTVYKTIQSERALDGTRARKLMSQAQSNVKKKLDHHCLWFGLLKYLRKVPLSEKESFLYTILPKMIELAFGLEVNRPQEPLHFSKQQQSGSFVLTRQFVCSVLACSFLCLFPERRREESSNISQVNFTSFFKHLPIPTQVAKLRCILHYFECIIARGLQVKGSLVFSRKVATENLLLTFEELTQCDLKLCPISIHSEGTIQDSGTGTVQVIFGNCSLGGGVLGRSREQEEIGFITCPELLAAMLFMEPMQTNEAIMVSGFEQFSCCTGYAETLEFAGHNDGEGQTQTKVSIDAMSYRSGSAGQQYEEKSFLRDLNKAVIGFSRLPGSLCGQLLFQSSTCTEGNRSEAVEVAASTAISAITDESPGSLQQHQHHPDSHHPTQPQFHFLQEQCPHSDQSQAPSLHIAPSANHTSGILSNQTIIRSSSLPPSHVSQLSLSLSCITTTAGSSTAHSLLCGSQIQQDNDSVSSNQSSQELSHQSSGLHQTVTPSLHFSSPNAEIPVVKTTQFQGLSAFTSDILPSPERLLQSDILGNVTQFTSSLRQTPLLSHSLDHSSQLLRLLDSSQHSDSDHLASVIDLQDSSAILSCPHLVASENSGSVTNVEQKANECGEIVKPVDVALSLPAPNTEMKCDNLALSPVSLRVNEDCPRGLATQVLCVSVEENSASVLGPGWRDEARDTNLDSVLMSTSPQSSGSSANLSPNTSLLLLEPSSGSSHIHDLFIPGLINNSNPSQETSKRESRDFYGELRDFLSSSSSGSRSSGSGGLPLSSSSSWGSRSGSLSSHGTNGSSNDFAEFWNHFRRRSSQLSDTASRRSSSSKHSSELSADLEELPESLQKHNHGIIEEEGGLLTLVADFAAQFVSLAVKNGLATGAHLTAADRMQEQEGKTSRIQAPQTRGTLVRQQEICLEQEEVPQTRKLHQTKDTPQSLHSVLDSANGACSPSLSVTAAPLKPVDSKVKTTPHKEHDSGFISVVSTSQAEEVKILGLLEPEKGDHSNLQSLLLCYSPAPQVASDRSSAASLLQESAFISAGQEIPLVHGNSASVQLSPQLTELYEGKSLGLEQPGATAASISVSPLHAYNLETLNMTSLQLASIEETYPRSLLSSSNVPEGREKEEKHEETPVALERDPRYSEILQSQEILKARESGASSGNLASLPAAALPSVGASGPCKFSSIPRYSVKSSVQCGRKSKYSKHDVLSATNKASRGQEKRHSQPTSMRHKHDTRTELLFRPQRSRYVISDVAPPLIERKQKSVHLDKKQHKKQMERRQKEKLDLNKQGPKDWTKSPPFLRFVNSLAEISLSQAVLEGAEIVSKLPVEQNLSDELYNWFATKIVHEVFLHVIHEIETGELDQEEVEASPLHNSSLEEPQSSTCQASQTCALKPKSILPSKSDTAIVGSRASAQLRTSGSFKMVKFKEGVQEEKSCPATTSVHMYVTSPGPSKPIATPTFHRPSSSGIPIPVRQRSSLDLSASSPPGTPATSLSSSYLLKSSSVKSSSNQQSQAQLANIDLSLDVYQAAAVIVSQVFQAISDSMDTQTLSPVSSGPHGTLSSTDTCIHSTSSRYTSIASNIFSSSSSKAPDSPQRTRRSVSPSIGVFSRKPMSRETLTNAFLKVEGSPTIQTYERRSSEPCQTSVQLSLQAFNSIKFNTKSIQDKEKKVSRTDDDIGRGPVWRRGSLDGFTFERRNSCGFKDPVLSRFAEELMKADTSVPELVIVGSCPSSSSTGSIQSSVSGYRESTLANLESELINTSLASGCSLQLAHSPHSQRKLPYLDRSRSRESRNWKSDSSDTEWYWFPPPRFVGDEFQQEYNRQHSQEELQDYAHFFAGQVMQEAVCVIKSDPGYRSPEEQDVDMFAENLSDQIMRDVLLSVMQGNFMEGKKRTDKSLPLSEKEDTDNIAIGEGARSKSSLCVHCPQLQAVSQWKDSLKGNMDIATGPETLQWERQINENGTTSQPLPTDWGGARPKQVATEPMPSSSKFSRHMSQLQSARGQRQGSQTILSEVTGLVERTNKTAVKRQQSPDEYLRSQDQPNEDAQCFKMSRGGHGQAVQWSGSERHSFFIIDKFATDLSTSLMESVLEDLGKNRWIKYLSYDQPIATGNWGCGTLHGNAQLKLVIQWIAASIAQAPVLLYYTMNNPQVAQAQEVVNLISQWTVGHLSEAVREYCNMVSVQLSSSSPVSYQASGKSQQPSSSHFGWHEEEFKLPKSLFEFLLSKGDDKLS